MTQRSPLCPLQEARPIIRGNEKAHCGQIVIAGIVQNQKAGQVPGAASFKVSSAYQMLALKTFREEERTVSTLPPEFQPVHFPTVRAGVSHSPGLSCSRPRGTERRAEGQGRSAARVEDGRGGRPLAAFSTSLVLHYLALVLFRFSPFKTSKRSVERK